MKHFMGLIPRYMLKNKKKTFFTGTTIMIAAMLITAVGIMIYNFQTQQMNQAIERGGGYYHGKINKIQGQYLMYPAGIIEEVGNSLTLGNVKVQDKYKLEIAGYDSAAQKLLNFKLIEGVYPSKEGEIALEKWMLDIIKPNVKLGDKIKLDYESYYSTPQGKSGTSNESQEFTLVGVLKDRYDSKQTNTAKACIVMEQAQNLLPVDFVRFDQYLFIGDNPNYQTIQRLAQRENRSIQANDQLINTLNLIKASDKILMFLNIIVVISVIAVIYNVFNISVLERLHQFGLLRAIGAEPFHIKVLIFGEGLILGSIFIPLGMVLGALASNSIYTVFSAISLTDGIAAIPKDTLMAAPIVCSLAIAVSIIKPAIQASKISPIAAINITSREQPANSKPNKTSRLNKKLDFTSNMALLSIKRNRKRFLATVASLSLSVMLFIDITSIVKWIDIGDIMKKMVPTDFTLFIEYKSKFLEFSDSVINEVLNLEGIKEIYKSKYFNSAIFPPGKRVSEEYKAYMRQFTQVGTVDEINQDKDKYFVNTDFYGCSDEEFKTFSKYLESGNIDISSMKHENIAIIVQNIDKSIETNLQVGDEFEIAKSFKDEHGEYKSELIKFKVGGILSKIPFMQVHAGIPITVIMHEDTFDRSLKIKGYQAFRINVNKNVNKLKFMDKLNELSKQQENGTVKSYEGEIKKIKDAQKDISLILYVFLGMTVIIAIVNIANTMSLNVILRKAEFGMLRAIGMGKDEVKYMIIKEAALYGIISGVIGAVFGIAVYVTVYSMTKRISFVTWAFPWLEVLYSFAGSVLISIVASISSLRRMKAASIIDSIRAVE